MRISIVFAGGQPGLFLKLTHDAARDVQHSIPDVIEVGRAGRKIDASGIRRVFAHHAEHEGAIGTAKRTHAEAVEYGMVGKAPVTPGQKTRKIGFEVAGAEVVAGKSRIAPEQDAAVEQRGPLALLLGKVRGDLGTARFGERPGERLHGKVK